MTNPLAHMDELAAYKAQIRALFPPLPPEKMLARLALKPGVKRLVLDTDTYNEVDDQFALVYALSSPEVRVEAVYAAPFTNDRADNPALGMELSYREIARLLGTMGISADGFAFRGSDRYIPSLAEPVDSPAAHDLIARAKASPDDDPLYVVAIGAITNVASALLLAPEIAGKIVVVWLGGNSLDWPTQIEFNLMQDPVGSRLLFDCGVPLMHMPCRSVASHMLASVYELEACLKGKNAVADALVELFAAYETNHFGWAKEIWDASTIGWLVNPDWVPSVIVHSPVLTDQLTFSVDHTRHFMRAATMLDRTKIFRDMFAKIGGRA